MKREYFAVKDEFEVVALFDDKCDAERYMNERESYDESYREDHHIESLMIRAVDLADYADVAMFDLDIYELLELLKKPHSKVAIIAEDGTNLTDEETAQGLLEQMIIYRDLDAQEGWQYDRYTLSVRIGSEEVYCYHHCTSTSAVLVEELEEALNMK